MRMFISIFVFLLATSGYSLESDDVTLIKRFNLIDRTSPIDDSDWNVNPLELDEDQVKFKGQDRNITDWKNLDSEQWLNIKIWMKERDFKDSFPEWRRRLREERNSEVIGRTVKCVGVCMKYHGTVRHPVEFGVKFLEGDEVYTDANSFLWIMLSDGALLKIMPETSVTLNEFNIGVNKTTILLRLNQGNLFYQPRLRGQYETLNKVESDLSPYPLKISNANREYYAIQEYRKLSGNQKLKNSIQRNPGYKEQYEFLNKLSSENSENLNKESEILLYTPNLTLVGLNSAINLFYETNGKSYFYGMNQIPNFSKLEKKKSELSVFFRGHNNKKQETPKMNKWYTMDKFGQNLNALPSFGDEFNNLTASLEFNTRIPTIQLGREILFKKYLVSLLSENVSKEDLALKFGYRLWDVQKENELVDRKEFIIEYIRRVETTNLNTIAHIYKNQPVLGYNRKYIARAMKNHFYKLKNRFSEDNLVVREMNDTEYYIWMIRND